MGYDISRATYEAELARAHRAISRAEEAAEAMQSPGAAYDCHLIALELIRLANDSLSGKRRRMRALDSDRA
jgi:hypothetical protein